MDIKQLLEDKYSKYNSPAFIEDDPIQVPHLFSKPENIEIAGFLTATIAWGQRKTIIKNARLLVHLMDDDPASFVRGANESDFFILRYFKHRTFVPEDSVYFTKSLQNIYVKHGGLRQIFENSFKMSHSVKQAIEDFRKIFLELPHQPRTRKHIADVSRNASGKRLNMFLRWMVRRDQKGVDFGLWKGIDPAGLFIPLDVHTGTVARNLGLLKRKQNDWKAVEELTKVLRKIDPKDPVKYDFALFGMGIYESI